MDPDAPLPPYSYVPGGPWPHPIRDPAGHSFGLSEEPAPPIDEDNWAASPWYLRGVRLFNEGYYWEAHEAWERQWHAQGRRGPTADALKALIKLAAAGVKAREGQAHGVRIHAQRAAELFETARAAGDRRLGLDLKAWAGRSRHVSADPPVLDRPDEAPRVPGPEQRPEAVFGFRIEPNDGGEGE